MEEWRDVPGEPGYQVSNFGRVKSLQRVRIRSNGRPQTTRERILKASRDEWGYCQVGINQHTYKVHRLVALAFLPAKPAGYEIRHLDGNPTNNHVSNLEYGSHSENVLDGYRYRGNIRKNQKLTEQEVRQIKHKLAKGCRGRDLAECFGVSEQTICDIKHGRIYARV